MKYCGFILSLLALSFVAPFNFGCGMSDKPPKDSTQARLNVPNWGIVIDANYDKKLDTVVPGYKILTVAVTNRYIEVIRLDPLNDRWFIEDAWGKKQKAVISLRISDPNAWGHIPQRIQDLMEYPAGVQMNYSQTFDLFFPAHVNLERFRGISFYSSALKQEFNAVSSAQLDRAVPANEQPQTPTTFPDKFGTDNPTNSKRKNR